MKLLSSLTLVVLLLLLQTGHAYGQTYELYVLNQVVSGTDLQFDIYLKRTGTTAIYLGNCDFVLTFNDTNFTDPTAEIIDEGLTVFYTFDAVIVASNRYIINLLQPSFSTQAQFNQRVTNISSSGDGEYVGTFRLTGISNPPGVSGLQWRNDLPNPTIVTTLAPVTPWNGTNITNPASHFDPPETPLPIQLVNFTATSISGNRVALEWTTLSETNNYGFEVQKAPGQPQGFTTISNSFIQGHGTTNEPHTYTYIDESAAMGVWYYRLKQIDLDGGIHYSDPVQVEVLTGVLEKPVPTVYSLDQNYPNPFNPATVIDFALPHQSHVKLEVYNIIGQKVATLVDEIRQVGYYSERFDAKNLASGLYFYRLSTNEVSFLKKMTILK